MDTDGVVRNEEDEGEGVEAEDGDIFIGIWHIGAAVCRL